MQMFLVVLVMCLFHLEEMIRFEKPCIRHFCIMPLQHGMNMGIVNPAMLEVYDEIPKDLLERVEDVFLDRRDDATERLLDFAETVKGNKKEEDNAVQEWRNDAVTRQNYTCLSKRN